MIHTAFPHAYIPRVSPISRLAWTSGHNRSSGTTVCRIPISCGKVIAASVWIVCRTGISAVYRFRWTSPPHFSSDPRNLQRKERKQCILIRISYESDQLLQGNWILNTYRKDDWWFFFFILIIFIWIKNQHWLCAIWDSVFSNCERIWCESRTLYTRIVVVFRIRSVDAAFAYIHSDTNDCMWHKRSASRRRPSAHSHL